jgi:GNAT superfamily N-acetyltransferase
MAAAKGTKSATRTTGISSLGPTAHTRTPSEILELGKNIVKEMGLDDDTDTLGRWMCHHVAGLIDQATHGHSDEMRCTAEREAVSTILALWEKRMALPGNAYPLARFKYLLKCLAATSPDASIWETRDKAPMVDAAGNLFRQAAEIANIALSLDSKPPLFERRSESDSGFSAKFLKMIEWKILSAGEDLDERSRSFLEEHTEREAEALDTHTKTLKALLKAIASTQTALGKLAEQMNEKLSPTLDSTATTVSAILPEWKTSVARKPLSQTTVEMCAEILKEGAAVDVGSARRGLGSAKKIALAKKGKEIIALATLKAFRPKYAAKIAQQSSAAIERDTLELGYVAVRQAYRGKGLGRDVVQVLLEGVEDALFATTASAAMGKILSEHGFTKSGKPWSGMAGRLTLWQRKRIEESA